MTANQKLGKSLYDVHPSYREVTLDYRRFKHKDILPILEKCQKAGAKVNVLGNSIEQRAIHEIKLGSGLKNIMMWTQMHGDEPTSSMALSLIHI